MTREPNRLARPAGGRVEHRLATPDGKTTVCGKDASLMNRYPYLTVKNSAVRDAFRPCEGCR